MLQFPLAHLAGSFGHFECDLRVTHPGSQNKGMAEEVIPQEHGRLTAPAVVDRWDMPAGFSVVENVIVDQGGRMHHLHGDSQIQAPG